MTLTADCDTFADIGLSSFLEGDDRPTIVFDVSKQSPSIAYSNPAFDTILRETGSVNPSVLHGIPVRSSSLNAPVKAQTIFAGATWTSSLLHERWKIVHPANLMQNASIDGVAASLANTSLDKINPDVPPMIDWTQGPVSDSTPYIEFLRAFDWDSTTLGPLASWPEALRVFATTIMRSPDPRLILWGPDDSMIYNEATVPIIGQKHPAALGRNPRYAFAELWDGIVPVISAGRAGKTSQLRQIPLPLARNGFDEETFFDFTIQPIADDTGRIVGILDSFAETTGLVVAERRMATIMGIGEGAAEAKTVDDVWQSAVGVLENNEADIPYALLYAAKYPEKGSGTSQSSSSTDPPANFDCYLEHVVGIDAEVVRKENIDVLHPFDHAEDDVLAAVLESCWRDRGQIVLEQSNDLLPRFLAGLSIDGRGGGRPTSRAVVVTIPALQGTEAKAFLILGISSRRPFDDDYRHFIRLITDRLTHAVATIALPQEQRLAQLAIEEAALRHASLTRQLYAKAQEADAREARFVRMYENAPVGMYLLRRDGSPIFINDAYSRITGIYNTEHLDLESGVQWQQYIHPEDVHLSQGFWQELTVKCRPAQVEHRLGKMFRKVDDATGQVYEGPAWIRSSAFPEFDEHGEVSTIVGWITDISLHKWTENLQEKRLNEAVEARRQSERFIDVSQIVQVELCRTCHQMVSHELRNPLSAILQSADGIVMALGASEVAMSNKRKTGDNETLTSIDSANTIVLCVQHMKRIVDDILTFSKLDSNLIMLAPEVLHPSSLLARALGMFKAEVDAADITTECRLQPSEVLSPDELVVCDGSRILQILINLITNAFKFTRDRAVRKITLRLHASRSEPGESPDGVNYIPKREKRPQSHVLEAWGSGPEIYLEFALEDTGPGLTRKEMEMLFQRFQQANPKTYSQCKRAPFYDIYRTPSSAANNRATDGGSGLGLFICKELCELHEGRIGVKSEHKKGSVFAFYVKCLKYDSKNSLSPRRKSLTRNEWSKLTEQRLGLSSSNLPPSKPGMIHHDPPMPTIGAGSVSEPASSPSATSKIDLSVLVVEDNLINQKVMAKQLRNAGCTVAVANHGLEAIEFLKKTTFASHRDKSHSPTLLHIILMDLEMPVMDGLSCVRIIRSMQQTGELNGHVNVAAVTANARSQQLNEALEAGMDIVVTKPFRISELMPQMLALVNDKVPANKNPIYSHVERTPE